jgi:hypothetical protein
MELYYATMRFLEDRLSSLPPSSDTDREINYISKILDKQSAITDVDEFIDVFIQNQEYIDYYIYLDIVGLHALLYKHDCDGYYSVGNAVDIIRLFDQVKPFVTNTLVSERLRSIYKLFRDSVKSKTIITIM